MDRGKNLPPKGSKVKPIGFAGDFIALGPKQGRPELADVKKPSPTSAGPSKSSPSPIPTGATDKKRDTPPVPLAGTAQVPPKKPKPGLPSSGAFATLGRQTIKTIDPPSPGSSSSRLEPWEDVAIEVEPTELLGAISEAEGNDDEEKIEALLCGAVKQLKSSSVLQRNKVEPILALVLVYLGKCRPQYFNTEHVVEALLALLRRDNSSAMGPFKGRPSAGAASLACNLILAGCQEEKNWPESFLKVFIEDSIGERFWVDREECQGFVENILTAFNTKVPPRNLLQTEGTTNPGGSSSGAASSPSVTSLSAFGMDDEASNLDSDSSQGGILRGMNLEQQQVQVIPRFQDVKDVAESLVMDVVNQHFGRRQQPPSDLTTRSFLKFLASTAGLPAVRLQAAQRLEIWLSNQKLLRPATDLLLSICLNCNTDFQSDTDTINALLRLRLKTKPLLQTYLSCFKEMVEQQPEQLPLIIRLLIFNELSPSRGPNNMAVLAVLVQPWPDRAATILADVFMELLLNRDDYLRALRALLREIIRALRQDLPLPTFCAALLQGTVHERRRSIIKEFEFKDRLVASLADLATLCIFLAISPTIRESAALISRIDLREMELFRQFQVQASTIQREAINWLRAAVPSVFEPSRADYIHCLRKVLFMESGEHYYNKDGWPPEVDRPVMIRLAAEIPVAEETFIQVLVIGLSREHPLAAPDALDLADQLLRRCAAVHNQGFLMLEADNCEIFDMVLRLTAYHYPENIVLPQGYTPPNLAISTLYWRAWMMLLMLTAHNPGSLGAEAWSHYPILRLLMEMCITNDFSSLTTMSDPHELQVAAIEKQQILEFESHLAAASTKAIITENNSLLLSQLTSLDPRGPVRRPPPGVTDQLRSLNATLKLGHLLCRSRQPDFLLEILHRQGPAQSKPWLAELVESNEGSWSVLPVQCLCEFLLHESNDDMGSSDIAEDGKQQLGKRKERRIKHQQLVQHIKQLLMDPNQPPGACREVLDYLMRRLSSKKAHGRSQALSALNVVLTLREDETSLNDSLVLFDGEESQYAWLVQHLPSIPHFQHVKSSVIFALRAALQVETQPGAVAAYIRFLATCALDEPLAYLAELCFDLGTVLIERSSLVNALLPSNTNQSAVSFRTLENLLELFLHYLLRARERNKDAYTWSEDQQLLLVQWQTGESASLHVYVIHAMVILLTYGEPKMDKQSSFHQLLDIWFPSAGESPQAFLVDTSEEALLYPDWLKLRMIRSSVLLLVDAALKDLEPKELILFIQSFGIPVASMTKLLHALDRMVQQNAFAFVEVDMDKAYMQQLLQVQWARGAQGGLHFADIMQMGEPDQEPNTDTKNIRLPIRPTLDLGILPSKQGQAPTEMNVELASLILRQLFDFKTVIRLSQPEKIKAYRNLSNAVSLETTSLTLTATEAVAVALDTLLASTSASKADFDMLLTAIERQPAFSCGILRLLTAMATTPKGSRLMPIVLTVCQKIAPGETEEPMSSLKSIAVQFLKHHGGARPSSTPIDTSILDLGSKRLERQIQQMASSSLEAGDTRSLICEIETNLSRNRTRTNYLGLLVDWLELLDPEIIKAQPEIETRLLFGRTPNPPLCRPYVTTLLVHQASWETLRKCTQQLLDSERDPYEPKVVLDFMAALVKVPKLWQGRDKHVPKHYEPEDLLHLNKKQLFRLSEYIMGEFSQLYEKDQPKALIMLGERAKLLLQCCGGSSKMEVRLARDVANAALNSRESRQKSAQQLLLQIYVYAPHVITYLPKTLPPFGLMDENKILLNSVPCALDSMAITLISAMTSTQPGKDGARKMADLDMALRKMAATHPHLLLRHFTSLASALRGRSHYDLPYLRSGNHFNLFACILGLIQQLGSKLFVPEHRQALEDMLDSYWSLFNYQKGAKDITGPLLQKFMLFLRDYTAYAPSTAFHVLQRHIHLLQDLQIVHPDMAAIKELVSALSRPRPNDSEEYNQPAWVPFRPTIRLGPILTRLRQSDNHDEMIQVLQDLENICNRMACAPLEGALADLRPLMCSSNLLIRNTTFTLLLRFLKDNPKASADLLPDYLECLENRNAAVVTTALERLPDLLVLCQENGGVLLQKTFSLAVESGFNTHPNLSEAVMLLQLQAAM